MKNKGSVIFRHYFLKFIFRAVVFLAVLYTYIFHRELLYDVIYFHIFENFSVIHLLWFVLMIGMILHLIPDRLKSLSGMKQREDRYVEPPEGYDRLALLERVQKMNIRAWSVLLAWVIANSCIAVLYLIGIISEVEMLLISMFYYLGDMICIVLFCPFQKIFMKCRCCVDCRIFDWGHFMMYTPMVFIKSFFSWSLFFMGCLILIKWEITYARHPERFCDSSNAAIRCQNCTDRMCTIRHKVDACINAAGRKYSTRRSTHEP